MQSNPLVNKGASVRQGRSPTQNPTSGRTFIISGIGRGGTTLVAEILREAGMHLGDHVADLVAEDLQILGILRSKDDPGLDRLIARRNEQHLDWGFKLPNIHAFLRYADLARFRNPHLILIFRDPQAIAVRGELAEYFDPSVALRDAAAALGALAEFVNHATCPCLLLSYEKALMFPESFVDALTDFCSLPVDVPLRQRLLDRVRPNADAYVNGARRRYVGAVDHLVGNILSGWCCELGELSPVDLDILVDNGKVRTLRADRFRADLLTAGYGNGNHGFAADVTGLNLQKDSSLSVRVSGRTFELDNSGRRVSDYELR
jgi:hypothetical protein